MRSNNGLIWGVVVGAVIVLVGGVYLAVAQPWKDNTNKSETKAVSEPSTNTSTSEQQKSAVTIVFTDDGFNPDSYTVVKGQSVTVSNKSSMDLQFSSDNHPTHTEEPELNMDVLTPGKSGTFTPTEVGTWTFHDHLRSEFTGTLKVTE